MSHISKIFERLNIQQIREFLLYGVVEMNVSDKSYEERLAEIEKPIMQFFQQKYPDADEYEKIANKIYAIASINEEVYMEIGLQCGFMLAMQMVNNTKPDQ